MRETTVTTSFLTTLQLNNSIVIIIGTQQITSTLTIPVMPTAATLATSTKSCNETVIVQDTRGPMQSTANSPDWNNM